MLLGKPYRKSFASLVCSLHLLFFGPNKGQASKGNRSEGSMEADIQVYLFIIVNNVNCQVVCLTMGKCQKQGTSKSYVEHYNLKHVFCLCITLNLYHTSNIEV